MPGFTRGEGLFLGLAALAITSWGTLGVDFHAARASGPGPVADVTSVPAAAASLPVASPVDPGPDRGRQLFEENGCSSCHVLDGPPGVGPDLRGIWGGHQALADGSTVVVDRSYFEESVLRPEARLVRGYKPAMPSYDGLLSAEDLEALAGYISSLR